jgi:hypothetical protein
MREPELGQNEDPYVERRVRDLRRLVRQGEVLFGEGYVYRPRELLCSAEDERRLEPFLREFRSQPDDRTNAHLAERRLDLRRWLLPDDVPVPLAVDRLRLIDPERPPVVGPNQVMGTEGVRWGWGGGGAPRLGPPLSAAEQREVAIDLPAIGVLDTGVATDTALLHPALFAHLADTAGDLDNLDDDSDGYLDSGAGHGTFVLGILHQLAPGLTLDAEPVLGAHGFGDDLTIAVGASQVKGGVINLSFGGYTHDDMEPPGLRAALQAAGPDVVFVAAAGNHDLTDPCWPAAFPDVIAVAALDTTGAAPVPAGFTNRGDWVDVCAPGVDVHSHYVRGRWPAEDSSVEDPEFDGYALWSGTSFAAPQVAAAIAAMAADQKIPARQAADQLLASLPQFTGAPGMGRLFVPPKDVVFHP